MNKTKETKRNELLKNKEFIKKLKTYIESIRDLRNSIKNEYKLDDDLFQDLFDYVLFELI